MSSSSAAGEPRTPKFRLVRDPVTQRFRFVREDDTPPPPPPPEEPAQPEEPAEEPVVPEPIAEEEPIPVPVPEVMTTLPKPLIISEEQTDVSPPAPPAPSAPPAAPASSSSEVLRMFFNTHLQPSTPIVAPPVLESAGTDADPLLFGARVDSVGPTGPTGPQGPDGPTGHQGVHGPQGHQGVMGYDGPQGVRGPQGVEGPTGPEGHQGLSGPTGTQGHQGFQGAEGPQGPQGVDGMDGLPGAQGAQGSMGAQGRIGHQGMEGPTGHQGVEGPQGPTGFDGAQGFQGFQGPEGPTGLDGPDGPAGPTGPQGTQGPQGFTGEQGFQGYAGNADFTLRFQGYLAGGTGTEGYYLVLNDHAMYYLGTTPLTTLSLAQMMNSTSYLLEEGVQYEIYQTYASSYSNSTVAVPLNVGAVYFTVTAGTINIYTMDSIIVPITSTSSYNLVTGSEYLPYSSESVPPVGEGGVRVAFLVQITADIAAGDDVFISAGVDLKDVTVIAPLSVPLDSLEAALQETGAEVSVHDLLDIIKNM